MMMMVMKMKKNEQNKNEQNEHEKDEDRIKPHENTHTHTHTHTHKKTQLANHEVAIGQNLHQARSPKEKTLYGVIESNKELIFSNPSEELAPLPCKFRAKWFIKVVFPAPVDPKGAT
jgi:ABC-type Zn2+ transport system substrate-binding protein/surface adhesin